MECYWYIHTHYISVSPEPPYSVRISGLNKLLTFASLNLTCYASGTVERYEWYHSGSRLPTTTRYYKKSPAQLSDSGSYQCKACNMAGCTSSSSYTVTVIGWCSRLEYMTIVLFIHISVYQCVLCVHVVFSIECCYKTP